MVWGKPKTTDIDLANRKENRSGSRFDIPNKVAPPPDFTRWLKNGALLVSLKPLDRVTWNPVAGYQRLEEAPFGGQIGGSLIKPGDTVVYVGEALRVKGKPVKGLGIHVTSYHLFFTTAGAYIGEPRWFTPWDEYHKTRGEQSK